jgi:hypothetical protein
VPAQHRASTPEMASTVRLFFFAGEKIVLSRNRVITIPKDNITEIIRL